MKNKKRAATGLGKTDIIKHVGVIAILAVMAISVSLMIGSGNRITTDFVEKPAAIKSSGH